MKTTFKTLGGTPWRMYWTAVRAVLIRDFRVYLRYPGNAFFSIIEPFAWMLPVVYMARAFSVDGRALGFQGYTGTTDFVSFYVVGGIISFYVSSVMWGIGFSLRNDMVNGVLETNWLTPVPPVVLLFGRSLWSLIQTTFRGIIAILIAGFAFRLSLHGGLWPALVALAPVLIGLYGLGFALAAAVLLTNDANNIIDMSNFLVGVLSGQQFPVQVLPRLLLSVSLILPITYGMDLVRGHLLGTTMLLPAGTEMNILLGVMVVFVLVGYVIFRMVERSVKSTGNLGFH